MPHPLCAALPDPKILLSLAPEDLGGVLLPILKELPGPLSGYSFVNEKHLFQGDGSYGFPLRDRVSRAIMEAWSWMITAGLLAPDPRQLPGGDWVFLTRRAEEIRHKAAFEAFRKASALPRTFSIRLLPTARGRTFTGATTTPPSSKPSRRLRLRCGKLAASALKNTVQS
jgi:hypothetical protein